MASAAWTPALPALARQRGTIILLSYFVVSAVAVGLSVGFNRSTIELRAANSQMAGSRAFHLAEAGIDRALTNFRAGNTASVTPNAIGTGTFSAIVDPSEQPTFRITSQGIDASGNSRTILVTTRLTPQSIFHYALFGNDHVDVSGNAITDSYDSSLGPYDSQTPGEHGDVGTNSSERGAIEVTGSIAINGQIFVGPDAANPSSVVTGPGEKVVTADPPIVSLPYELPMPEVELPEGLTCADMEVGDNSTMTLASASGPYCFRNVTVNGGGVLTADGPVTVYLTGTLFATGNTIVGVPDSPTSMLFLVTTEEGGATLEGTLTGSSQFYGALYGPQATIHIQGNAEVYGSIIGEAVDLSGSAVLHYDEALKALTEIPGYYLAPVLSWQEL
ncbi:MAG TPA: hypothetical protein VGB20_02310 [bacterium]